ncbi:MAG: hypothetical protein QNJ06_00660 [Kiloniellales bacterium]|nr:hypothetical protein [Kiloniellales bacterium]MDJ0968379.1 hypothetical protein [Kiloniellales bacterium]MDJ0981148.1 hypothetical protein [Kiloniellales bacterium]
MKNSAQAFLRDEQGAAGIHIGLGVALVLEVIFVAVDWLSKV